MFYLFYNYWHGLILFACSVCLLCLDVFCVGLWLLLVLGLCLGVVVLGVGLF